MNTCKICQTKKNTFLLELKDDNNEEYTYQTDICGDCWSIIAEIASKVIDNHPIMKYLQTIENRLEVLELGKGK